MDWQTRYMDRFYRSRPGWLDGTEEFWRLCKSAIEPGSKILEIGAGPTNPTSEFLSKLGELDGVDVDPEVRSNSHLRTASLLVDGQFPFEDGHFDACVSNYVLEHIQDPIQHLREVSRVLRPGGSYVFRAPNKWHYVAVVARLTPHWFHESVANRLRRLPPGSHDPYPTVYRLNTRAAIKSQANEVGFTVEGLHMIEKEPSYGQASRVMFLLFVGYERMVNCTEYLAGFRVNVLGHLRRPLLQSP